MEILFDRPNPTEGSSANGRRRRYIQSALHSTEKFTGLLGEFMVHSKESASPRHSDKGASNSVTAAVF